VARANEEVAEQLEIPAPNLPLPAPAPDLSPLNYDQVYADLSKWEGAIPWMYLDSKGLVTVGCGLLLKTTTEAQKLPFLHADLCRPATSREVETAFAAVSKMQRNLHSARYKLAPSIELDAAQIKRLAVDKLEREFLPAIRKYFAEFDSYPEPARRVLLDLAYNGGVRGTSRLALAVSVRKRNWHEAAKKVPVRGQPNRTKWRRDLLLAAATVQV
jgi:GH24 family phage-related lysozyme (muramidase)